MKGLVLAGGTATRLFPLTIVTNKHLLPIYDRPMIYYPLDTLAGMGIREVMVIVGGKSVGDIVELLGDGRHFGLDLTYRYQRGALGIAHAIGLARDFIGDDGVLRRARRQHPARRAARATPPGAFDAGPWGAGTLLYRVRGPGAVRRRGARRGGHGHRLRGEARAAQERPDPDRRLLPPPGRVRRHRGPRPVRPRRVRDHRRAQPLHPRRRPVRRGLRGPVGRRRHRAEPRCGAAELAEADDQAGTLPAPVRPIEQDPANDRPTLGARAHLLVTGGAGLHRQRAASARSSAGATGRGSPSSTS